MKCLECRRLLIECQRQESAHTAALGMLAGDAGCRFASESIMLAEIGESVRLDLEVARVEFERHWLGHGGADPASSIKARILNYSHARFCAFCDEPGCNGPS